MPRLLLPSLFIVCLLAGRADAKIINPVTLEQLVKDQPLIFTAKVVELLPEKPGLVFTPVDKLRGEFAFDRVPVNLTGDKEAIDEKQPKIVLERLEKDLPIVIFAGRRGRNFDAVAYTNGTWIRLAGTVEKDGDKEVTRWRFLHCETYFRRTFKGTTQEMIDAVKSGLKGGKLPGYDEKVEPGYGPPLKGAGAKEPYADTRHQTPDTSRPLVSGVWCLDSHAPFAVIQLPFIGLIAALAALFPAVFGGAAIMMRRWVGALSVASFVSILAALAVYFPNWIAWTGIRSLSTAWLVCAGICLVGAFWTAARYRRANREGRSEEFQPRYLDRIGLAVIAALIVGGLLIVNLMGESVRESPWLELVLLLVPTVVCLFFVVGHWLRTRNEAQPVAVSAETVGVWAGMFACAIAGVAMLSGPRGPAMVAGGGSGGVKLVPEPLWIFEPKDKGEIVSTPCVNGERVYVTVHHRPNPVQQYGIVYSLDANTGQELWRFDDEEKLKPMFCSPTFADGAIFFGEGYHTDRESKMFCVNAADGKKIWDFTTTSHTESTPAVFDGKVVFGAGDDGVYCLDAKNGTKLWQYPPDGGLHVDSNLLIHDGRVYGGSGTSKKSKSNRIFCLDLKTGAEIWGEKIEHSAWGSPNAFGNHVYFVSGNGTFSEDRAPILGQVLCREATKGAPVWERTLPNSVVVRPAVDRYQVYVGSRDGNCYALDRHSGEIVWSKHLQAPVLASPTIDVNPAANTGEALYVVGSMGQLEALSPIDGSLFWSVSLRNLVEAPHVTADSTPVVVREMKDGKVTRRVLIGLGFGSSKVATPTARLYCFLNTSE